MEDGKNTKANSNEQARKTPPRPPVLPRSYAGAPITKPSVNRDSFVDHTTVVHKQNDGVNNVVKPVHVNDSVVISTSAAEESLKTETKNDNSYYSRTLNKKSLVMAVSIVALILLVVGGGIFLFVNNLTANVGNELFPDNARIIDKPNAEMPNLNSLKKIKNLRELRLYHSDVKNIDGISNLTKLQIVYLPSNEIKDIRALKNLTNITYLDLRDNDITDISALKGLTKLKTLLLKGNNIKDLSPLAELTNLVELDLSYNQIVDPTPLKKLTKLERLKLNNNKIVDIKALSGMTNLKNLYLRENGEIKDLTPIIGMNKMEWCSFNPRNLEIDIINQLKEANPKAIYYFYYKGDNRYSNDDYKSTPPGKE